MWIHVKRQRENETLAQKTIDFFSKNKSIGNLSTPLPITWSPVMCAEFDQSWFFHQDKWANSCSKQCRRHQTQSSNTSFSHPLFSISQRERERLELIETLINGLNSGLYSDYAKLLNTVSLWQHTSFLPTKMMFYLNSKETTVNKIICTPWFHWE